MKTLTFNVSGQRLTSTSDNSGIVRGSKGYLDCRFTFDRSWVGMSATAVFTNGKTTRFVPITGGKAMVPDDITTGRYFRVAVQGETRTALIDTNKITITQEG